MNYPDSRWKLLVWRIRSVIRRQLFCRFGRHGNQYFVSPVTGETESANFCGHGCGKVFNPKAYQPWVVTLRLGETVNVEATSEAHARKLVIYGGPMHYGAIIKVHPDNIVSAVERVVDPCG